MSSALYDGLLAAVPVDEVRRDVPLSSLGRWRIGGPADILVEPRSRETLAAALRAIKQDGLPHVVIGDGSNLLFDDAGLRGVVLKIGRAFGGFTAMPDGRVRAGAGLWVPSFVRATINAGLAGVVHAIGIPGTLGGLCTMNGGSQRKGIGDHIISVEAMDYQGKVHRIGREALGYAYRRSRLQEGGLIVLDAELQLEPTDDKHALRREAIEIMAARRAKFPKVRANCGSVFVSDPELYTLIGPPGRAIEQAALKGVRRGDAQISPDHANFIVNNGAASSADVLALIKLARDRVHALSGVAMDAEVRHLAPDATLRAAHQAADEFARPHSTEEVHS